jgi:hypothetical protein
MSMLVYWVVMPCRLVGRYQRFGETCCLHFQAYKTDIGLRYLPIDFTFSSLICAMLTSFLILHTVASNFPVAAGTSRAAFSNESSNFRLYT